jgi:DNA-binding transcriptional LysR family regulator
LTFAQVVLPQVRRTFGARYPDVTIRQTECNQAEIFEGLRRAELDVALTYDMQIPPDLEFVELVGLPPYALFDETHPLADRNSVTPAELAPFPMVLLDLPYSSDYFLSVFTRAGITPLIAERTRDMGVMRALVANGFGYSIANIRPSSDRAPDGMRLRYVPLDGSIAPMRMGLALAEGARGMLTIRAFLDHCQTTITPDSAPGIRLRLDAPGAVG